MSVTCPICLSSLNSSEPNPSGRDVHAYDCPRCGKFMLTNSLVSSLAHVFSLDSDANAKLSHAIQRAQTREEQVMLDTHTAYAVLKHPLPRPREQADLLIRWLATNLPSPGEKVWVEYKTHGSVIGSKTPSGFELVIDHLFSIGLVTGTQSKTIGGRDKAYVTLTFAGWDYYERLRQGGAVYRKAFMAMKFGDETLNMMLDKVFKPSAKRAGFDLIKLDDIPKAGLIDDRLRVEIQSADFIIADLTHDNYGAYWEAGYAEGLGKPVIYTCEKTKFASSKTHFDMNHHLTILWDSGTPEISGNDLVATIRATLPHLAYLIDD